MTSERAIQLLRKICERMCCEKLGHLVRIKASIAKRGPGEPVPGICTRRGCEDVYWFETPPGSTIEYCEDGCEQLSVMSIDQLERRVDPEELAKLVREEC